MVMNILVLLKGIFSYPPTHSTRTYSQANSSIKASKEKDNGQTYQYDRGIGKRKLITIQI